MKSLLGLCVLVFLTQPSVAFAQECAPPGPGLVGWWPGEADATDLISGNNGALVGASFQPGEVGSGFSFRGDGYVEIPDSETLRLSADSASSLDAWVYPTSWPATPVVPLTAVKPYYYGLLYFPNDHILRAHVNDGHRWIYVDAYFDVPLEAWTHVAQTWDGNNLSIYANGQLLGTGNIHGNVYERLELPAFIGRWLVTVGDSQDFLFSGIMDEVGIYNAALEPSRVQSIFHAGSSGRCSGPPPPPFRAELVQNGLRCVSLMLSNEFSVKGGEIGIAFDPAVASLRKVSAGADFPLGGEIHSQASPEISCTGGSGVAAGFTVGWFSSIANDSLVPPGRHELLNFCFTLVEGAPVGSCSDLRFVTCLGPSEAPVRNVVTDEEARSEEIAAIDGTVCLQEESPFRRGDANGDGLFDISDPIAILGCLFLGTECSRCPDAGDANDDGGFNISDPTYLLNWRFLGGSSPPAPFSSCGQDTTTDDLDDCEDSTSC